MYLIIACAAFLFASTALARFDRTEAERLVKSRIENDERRALARDAFDAMWRLSARMLREHNRQDDAARLIKEWENYYSTIFGAGFAPMDMGDWVPYSQWTADWYATLEAQLGKDFLELSRLKDIWILNYSLPVVFYPKQGEAWCTAHLRQYPRDTCEKEYARHFVGTKYTSDPYNTADPHAGYSGVVTFWSIWSACQIATHGTGWFVICTPAGTLGQIAVEKYVAPEISAKIWDRNN